MDQHLHKVMRSSHIDSDMRQLAMGDLIGSFRESGEAPAWVTWSVYGPFPGFSKGPNQVQILSNLLEI